AAKQTEARSARSSKSLPCQAGEKAGEKNGGNGEKVQNSAARSASRTFAGKMLNIAMSQQTTPAASWLMGAAPCHAACKILLEIGAPAADGRTGIEAIASFQIAVPAAIIALVLAAPSGL